MNKVDPKRYMNETGNTYRVERAANKKWLACRYNLNNNRKLFKAVEPRRNRDEVQVALDSVAKLNGWVEIGE